VVQYLGVLRGTGDLICGDEAFGAASYELDGFVNRPGEVIASGELRMEAAALNSAFGRRDLQLRTEDGRLLQIRFSAKRLAPTSSVAHIDAAGDLPPANKWKPKR
jgi:hypothetical protein